MCYGNNYQCAISCINSDLNMTSAMNETINAVWWPAGVADGRCQVTACELVEHVSEGGMNLMGADLTTGAIIAVVGMAIAIVFIAGYA